MHIKTMLTKIIEVIAVSVLKFFLMLYCFNSHFHRLFVERLILLIRPNYKNTTIWANLDSINLFLCKHSNTAYIFFNPL